MERQAYPDVADVAAGRVARIVIIAGIAQLVEHHVANVNVASSSLVSRSRICSPGEDRGGPRFRPGA